MFKKAVLFAAITALLTISAAYGQPMGMKGMADELKLSDQQIQQLEKLHLQLEKNLISLQADLKVAKLDLREIMMQTNIDEEAALDKLDQVSSIKANIAKMKLQQKFGASKILTADQRAQFRKMHRDGMRGPGGRGKGCNGPCCKIMGPMMGGGMMGGPMMGGPTGQCHMGQGKMQEEEKEENEHPSEKPGK